MKKLAYLTCLTLAGVMATSCELDAPNQSTMSEDVIFSTEELANLAVMGLHQSFGETNSYRGRFIPYFGTNTDCEIFNNYAGVAEPALDKEASLACYSAHYDNTYMNTANNAWAKLYEAIERANKAVESMEKFGGIKDNANMGQIYGELLTLRAMIYFDLVKAWGDVPYRFEPITSETIYLPKTDRVTILKKLLEDLKNAEQYLSWPGGNAYTKSTERVSLSFAKGLRARTALFLAGKSEWPNEGLRYNLTNEAERQEMYQIAYEECTDIIEAPSHPNTLGSFEENFRALCEENTTAGKESIYEIPFSDGRGRVLYTWGGKHSNADSWTALAKGGVVGPTPTLWYEYDPQDIRRNITCLPYQWKDGKKTLGSTSGGGWSFGKLRFEWMKRFVTSTNDDGINFQVMRYADIYLMAAEAANERGDIQNAQKYLQPIVARAYPAGKAEQIMRAANSKEAMFQTIVEQRKFEFAGEAIRKVDLMRWGLLSDKLKETKDNMTALANRTGKFAAYPQKVYYSESLGSTDADEYYIYGLEAGEDDETGKALQLGNSSALFCLGAGEDADKIKANDDKIKSYINYLYINDPNSKMFWPIWKEFLNSSNGQLKNDYGYEN